MQVKAASDAALGLPSLSVFAQPAGIGSGCTPRGRLAYLTNLALRINTLLGGANVRLAGDPAQVGEHRMCVCD